MILFEDRRDGGLQLAERLQALKDEPCVVLGLPRGGVPVAYEVARALKAPLDVFLVRKLGSPMNPEYAIGAIASGGVRVLDNDEAWRLGLSAYDVGRIETRERAELARRESIYRRARPPEPLAGKTVIIVDDGIATGSTMIAALRAVRHAGASRVIAAAPVIAADTLAALTREADQVVYAAAPKQFLSVSSFYHSFPQTSDAEVRELLTRGR